MALTTVNRLIVDDVAFAQGEKAFTDAGGRFDHEAARNPFPDRSVSFRSWNVGWNAAARAAEAAQIMRRMEDEENNEWMP